MEDYSNSTTDDVEGCPQLLDLIPRHGDLIGNKVEGNTSHTLSEERKLDLSLGPPGGEWTTITDKTTSRERDLQSLVSFGYFSASPRAQNPVMEPPWQHQSKFHHIKSTGQQVLSQHCVNGVACVGAEKKAFSEAAPANPVLPSSSTTTSAHKRTAPGPVVGWPPIRSFRKTFASGTSSKHVSEPPGTAPGKVPASKLAENCSKTLFVKINMDGIPIGRKVNLKAYDSYQKLSYAVDELFRGLLAAQSDSSVDRIMDKESGGKPIGDISNGCGEYTLVYEDNEGDRMLVGDVPWDMFVATVKRLRVLKSSELPTLSRGSKQGRETAIK